MGKCCWIPELPEPAAVGGFVTALRPDSTVVHPRYLYHWFSSGAVQAQVRSFGNKTTSISNLSVTRCEALPFPLLRLGEQRRIAAILDKADALRAQRRAQLAHLDALPQAIFHEMFGQQPWEHVALESISVPDGTKCGPFGTQLQRSEFTDTGVPLIGIKSVNSKFEIKPWEFVDFATSARLTSYSIQPGDVVMTRKGTIGNCATYPKDWEGGIMHSDLLRVRVDQTQALPRYIEVLFHSSSEIRHQVAAMSPGAVMPGINVSKLKKLRIPVPPLALQGEFTKLLEHLDDERSRTASQGQATQTLFASLQSRAFRGEL